MITCNCCGRSLKIGQRQLSSREVSVLRANKSESLSTIEWQIVKATAEYFGTPDWTSVADTSLSYEENIHLMEQHGTTPAAGPSSRRDMPIQLLEQL